MLNMLIFASQLIATRPKLPAVVEVPLIRTNASTPIFEAQVGGKTRRFLLDTAASSGMLASRLVRELKLKPHGSGIAGDSSGNVSHRVEALELDSMKVGTETFKHITVVGDPTGTDAGPLTQVDGILALDSFGGRVVTIDGIHKLLRIGGTRLEAKDRLRSVEFRSDHGCPLIPAKIGKAQFEVRLDSGSEMGLLLPNSLRKSLHLTSTPVKVGSFRTMFNTFSIEQAQISDGVDVGGQTLTLRHAFFSDAFPVANLGSQAMANLSLTISPGEHRIAILQGSN